MSRLPIPGGDVGNWGKILNDFLRQSHHNDGSISKVDGNFAKLQLRRATSAQWAASNPTLAAAEFGIETDTKRRKIGTDLSRWADLPYDLTQDLADEIYASQLLVDEKFTNAAIRGNHTGTQEASTIRNFDSAVDARIISARVQAFPSTMATPPVITVGDPNAPHSISPGRTELVFPNLQNQEINQLFTVKGAPSRPPYNAGNWFTTINTIQTGRLPARLEFMHDGTSLEVQMRGGGSTSAYRFIVDGEFVSPDFSPNLPGDLASYWVRIDFGGRNVRHIVIEFDCQSQFGAIRHEATGGIYRVPDRASHRVIAMGDSWTQGANSMGNKYRDGFAYQAGHLLGWSDIWASGIGGTGYLRSAGYATYGERIQDDCLRWNPDIVIVSGGTNDRNEPDAVSRIQDAARDLFENIKSAPNNPKLIVIRPFFGPAVSSSILAIDAGVAAAAEGVADVILDPLGEQWLTGTGSVGAPQGDGNRDVYIVDGHPTRVGYRYIGSRIAACLTGITF